MATQTKDTSDTQNGQVKQSDGSDSDIPISSLKKEVKPLPKKIEDESDDDIPLSKLVSKAKVAKNMEDSDDDIPLAQLKEKTKASNGIKLTSPAPKIKGSATPSKKRKIEEGTQKDPKKPKAESKSESKSKKETKKSVVKPKNSTKDIQKQRDRGIESFILDTRHPLKLQAVARILCRWWYCMEWPLPEDIIEPPPGYMAFRGFPGVYICIEGDEMGKLLDNRSKKNKPSFVSLLKKDSQELKELWRTGITKQMEELAKYEGEPGTNSVMRALERELKQVEIFDPEKSEAQCRKLAKKKKQKEAKSEK